MSDVKFIWMFGVFSGILLNGGGVAGSPSSIDWCGLQCSGGQTHTICEYGCNPSSSVAGCQKYALSKEEKNAILKAHNELRNKIALGEDERVPASKRKVANMMAMSFDETVAYPAQCWTAQCDFNHDKCRRTPDYERVGQNIARSGSSANPGCSKHTLLKMTKDWYESEIAMLTENEAAYDQYAGGGWGHYSQVIWAESSLLGCAASESDYGGTLGCYIACNYAPAGNMLGDPIYTQGEPASKCPDGKTNSEFAGLCGEIRGATNTGARRIHITPISSILLSIMFFVFGMLLQ